MDYYNLEHITYPSFSEVSLKDLTPLLLVVGTLSSLVVVKEFFKIVFYNEYDNLEGEILNLRAEMERKFDEMNARIQALESGGETVEEDEGAASEAGASEAAESEAAESEAPEEDAGPPTESQNVIQEQTASGKLDNNAKVRKHLLNREVYVTYKGKTASGTIKASETAPHGYVILSDAEEFKSLTSFSTSKKSAINPNLQADNGWDSVYVVTGVNTKGKPTKKSIRAYIADLA